MTPIVRLLTTATVALGVLAPASATRAEEAAFTVFSLPSNAGITCGAGGVATWDSPLFIAGSCDEAGGSAAGRASSSFGEVLALGPVVYAASAVPFHASINTEITPLFPGPCATCLTLNISGSGQALHMGRVSIDGPLTIDFATTLQDGVSTVTAADGSTIVMIFTGTFIPTGAEDATFAGTWVSSSGTGRFAGESGSGTYFGSATGSTGHLTLDGTLSNPGNK